MRTIYLIAAAVLAFAGPVTAQSGEDKETFARGNCWLLFDGFGQTQILDLRGTAGAIASTIPGDVVDIIQLFSLEQGDKTSVIRVYELRDGTKFVCNLDLA